MCQKSGMAMVYKLHRHVGLNDYVIIEALGLTQVLFYYLILMFAHTTRKSPQYQLPQQRFETI